MREEVEALEHHADLTPDGLDPAHVVGELGAVDDDPAAVVLLQAVDAADQGGLARPRRADHDDDLLPADDEVDPPQRGEVAEPLLHALAGDDRLARAAGDGGGVGQVIRCARFRHRVPTPIRASSRRLSRDIVYEPTQYTKPGEGERDGGQPLADEVRLAGHAPRHVQHLEEPDDGEQRRVLEEADELADDRRDHVAQGLREHDAAHRLQRAEAQRLGGLQLTVRDRLQPAAHDLRDVGALEQRDHDQRPDEEAGRIDEGRDGVEHEVLADEQEGDERHGSEQLDVAHRDDPDRGQARPASEGGEHTHRERQARSPPR